MRTWLCILLLGPISCLGGCKLLEGYYYQPVHFKYGTVQERDYSKSVHKMYVTAQRVFKDRGFSVRRAEMASEEEAQIRAFKDGVEYVVDIQGVGDGCKVHLELDQAGNDAETWSILNELEQYP